MNLNQLKYFYQICISGSLSEASEQLYISQPSLSSAIKSLEKEFGVKLFNRNHFGMQLTAEGQMLFRSCKDLITRAEQLENVMKDLGSQRHTLRLGVPPMIGYLILPSIYCDFCNDYPDVKLEITEGGRTELLDKLSDHTLDMAFILQNNPIDNNFTSNVVGSLNLVCCVSKDNSISNYKSVTPNDLKDKPLILFENSFFQTEKIKKWFASGRIAPNIIMQTTQLSTMLTMIANNVAAGFTFKELAQTNNSIVTIPTEIPITADLCLVWNKNSYNFNSMEKFRSYINNKNPLHTLEKR